MEAEGDFYSELEKLVIRYAEQVTRTTRVDASTVKALQAHLSNQQVVELSFVVALANMTNRLSACLGVELEKAMTA